jgi:hypothetical protein
MSLESTQPLTEINTSNLPGGKGRSARKADNLTVICEPIENVGASTSHNPTGLHGLLQGSFTFTLDDVRWHCIIPRLIRYSRRLL